VDSGWLLGVPWEKADALVGVLERFFHDPLADLAKESVSAGRKGATGEVVAAHNYGVGNEGNKSYITEMWRPVDRKLKCMMGRTCTPLSIWVLQNHIS
jgi:hypothetical protein